MAMIIINTSLIVVHCQENMWIKKWNDRDDECVLQAVDISKACILSLLQFFVYWQYSYSSILSVIGNVYLES